MGRFRRLLRCAVLFLAVISASAWQATVPQPSIPQPAGLPNAAEINSILQQLSDITSFRVRHQLPFRMITRTEINAYIKDQIRHSVRPKDIYAEELSLKKLGFVMTNVPLPRFSDL